LLPPLSEDSEDEPQPYYNSNHQNDLNNNNNNNNSIVLICDETTIHNHSSNNNNNNNSDYYRTCVPNNECATSRIFYCDGGTPYNVSWDENEIKNTRSSDVYRKVRICNCSTASSAKYHTLFRLDVGADYHPDLFLWELLNKYRNVSVSKSNYEDGYTHCYYG